MLLLMQHRRLKGMEQHNSGSGIAALLLMALSAVGNLVDAHGLDADVIIPLMHLVQLFAAIVSLLIGLKFLTHKKRFRDGKENDPNARTGK